MTDSHTPSRAEEQALYRLDTALDGVDASVFSGELLFSQTHRELLKSYIARWSKAIAEHELMELLEAGAPKSSEDSETSANSLAHLKPEEREILSNFIGEVKGLCSSYSDKQQRPMMGDVVCSVRALIYWFSCNHTPLFEQIPVFRFLNTTMQICETLSKPNTPLHKDLVFKGLDKVCEDFELQPHTTPTELSHE